MNWLDTVRTGLEAIRTHRLRSGLTMLGILIGIAAVILTVGLGEGAQAQVRSQINALGTNLLIVSPGSSTSTTGIRGGFGSASTLTKADADALASKTTAPDIAAVAPATQGQGTLVAGSTNWTTTVVGTTPSWLHVRARTLDSGRFITSTDEQQTAAVVVLGPSTASELFGGRSPIGQTVTLNGIPLQVVGVLASTGSSSNSNNDDTAVVPYSTATQRLLGGSTRTSVGSIFVEASSSSTLSAAYQETQQELLAMHHIATPTGADFTITTQQSLLTTANSVNKTLTVLLGGIAGISLLVGGIGVMNIMLVSVTERIREIGLRKALGARPGVIRRQFLVEASVLGLTGGVLGAVVGVVGSQVLPHFISSPVALSPTATAAAIAIAIAIGLSFGVYPATRAARLAPIDALRME
ncbi:MAG: ABC transporter permease [Actinobacteria bacterium]|nr:ABC transporter permease [Actinomycetota bacterium]MBV9256002.1 ABC transporter permease [Actinomycetota bacterium]